MVNMPDLALTGAGFRMREILKYSVILVLCIVLATVVSYVAFYGFWFGARVFHSVPVARACDLAGSFVLLPARFIYSWFGGVTDQSTPLSDPVGYSMTNGIFLGTLFYGVIRPLLARRKKAE